MPLLPRTMILDEFLPLRGRAFQLDCDPKVATVTLVEATPLPQCAPDSAIRPPFSLIFHSPADMLLVDGTYAMRCEDFGPDLIFITPVIARPGAAPGYYYQAVFN